MSKMEMRPYFLRPPEDATPITYVTKGLAPILLRQKTQKVREQMQVWEHASFVLIFHDFLVALRIVLAFL